MKRIALLLLLAMLLAGCTQNLPENTQPNVPTGSTQPTQPQLSGIYAPGSALEEKTFGRIHAYTPGQQTLGMTMMGERLLVVSAGEADAVRLTVYEGMDCVPVCSADVAGSFRLEGAAVNVTASGISYYDERNREAVRMGTDLLEQERVLLPENVVGEPAISHDFSTVYYSTGAEIRVMEIKTGITRLLRTMNCQTIALKSLHFDNTVLECQVIEAEESYTAFLSAETGETLGVDEALLNISTQGSRFFLQRRNASVVERLYGSFGEEVRALNPAAKACEGYALPEIGSVLTAAPMEEPGVNLDLYDLASGNRSATVVLPDYCAIFSPAVDAAGENIWFVAADSQGSTVICRWELANSKVSNTTDYTSVRYTRQSPDTEGLARCQAWADALNQRYGVDIDAQETNIPMNGRYTAVSEYQVPALEQGLAALEAAMGRFPEDFFTKLAQVSSDGVLHIRLVQSIRNNGDGSAVSGLRYWVSDREYIALVIGDGMEQSFYHEVCHAMDTFILANSGVLDTWDDLNPKGFAYDENYTDYLTREDTQYLEGEDRAFVDAYSMSYPMEDRAGIFEWAMQAGNGDVFAPEAMQAKLKLLCKAIRDAFGWKEDPREFPWEQYLEKSMAYTKK